ncbi:hypothetical protein BC941DRAFT_433541 [Chlamydoabsidia padenii]|nr:hypothetical protein BC941DRAFT_433541 [Chlamydoabsidia padenii]
MVATLLLLFRLCPVLSVCADNPSKLSIRSCTTLLPPYPSLLFEVTCFLMPLGDNLVAIVDESVPGVSDVEMYRDCWSY